MASATRSQRPRSSVPSSIIAVRLVPASSERNSVWPMNLCPARMMDSLLTGAVTSASSSPRRQRCAPSRSAATAALAASGEPAGRFSGSGSASGLVMKNFPLSS